MRVQLNTALAVLLTAGVPMGLAAAPQKSTSAVVMTEREVAQAEGEARTAADHLRLAEYYQAQAQRTKSELADAEDTLSHWSWMEGRTKVPNPYTSTKSRVDILRAQYEKDAVLATHHEEIAKSLQGGPTQASVK
jgi:hypothetical protein